MKDCYIKVNPDNARKKLYMLEKSFPEVKWFEGQNPTGYFPQFSVPVYGSARDQKYLLIRNNRIVSSDNTRELEEFHFRSDKLKRILE